MGANRPLNPVDAGDSPAKGSELTPEALVSLVVDRLGEEKAEDVVTIDLSGKSDVADSLVIASGRSQRHVAALADKLSRMIKETPLGSPKVEGLPSADWVLIDAGDVIVHLFRPEVREFYNLERIWAPERFTPAST
ncbi:MAG: ribosome silencing factor [Pseudomonadota bacterium]